MRRPIFKPFSRCPELTGEKEARKRRFGDAASWQVAGVAGL